MKTLLLQKFCAAALGGALALSAHGVTVFVEDDFESGDYFDVDSLNWGSPGGWEWSAASDLEFHTSDPDNTSNQSVRVLDGSGKNLQHKLFGANVPAPTNAAPVVFSFSIYDTMDIDEDTGELMVRQSFGTFRQDGGSSHFVAAGIWSSADTGTFDKTRYQARVMASGGANWYQLAAERSEGWQHFKIVIHEDSVDIWVNGELDPNGVALPRASGISSLNQIWFGGGHAAHFDNVRLAVDETEARAIDVSQQPAPLTLAVGDEAVFSVVASGDAPLTYQWQKDGVDLFDGSGISGAETDTLTIASVGFTDDAVYRVKMSDGSATQNSALAKLTVHPFLFTQQPEGVVLEFGQDAVMSVAVHGEGTFTYQWQKDGVDVSDGAKFSGATTDTLTITDVQAEDSGTYTVVVENLHGERTSDGAPLSGGPPPTGVRFADFEEFEAQTANGTVMFRWPSYSGSSRGLLAGGPNTSQVVDQFPEGTWGAKVFRAHFAFDPNFQPTDSSPWPWLRLTTHELTILGNPIIGFDRWLRFEIFTTEDIYVTLGVRESNSTGAYGEKGAYTGDFQFIGGSADDPGPFRLPQKGVLVTAGSWQTVAFDLPNEFVKPGLVGGDDKLDGAKGILEELAIRPVIAEDGTYASVHEIFLDNFEVTEVAPEVVDPPSGVAPVVNITRGNGADVELIIVGEASTSYDVEVSTDLATWTALGTTTTDSEGLGAFTDAGATDSFSRRFYRVSEQQ